MKVRVNIRRTEDGGFLVYNPVLQEKCWAQDKDREKAIEYFGEAVRKYLGQEGADPVGKDYETLEVEL